MLYGQNPREHNPGQIWQLGQRPRVHFQDGGHNPRYFLHLLFMEFILFKIVKYAGITFSMFIFHGMLWTFVFFIKGNSLSILK